MRWVEVHARLLECSRDAQALTPSQAIAAATIVNALNNGVTYLNLWGPPGVGKTFLARHLAQHYQGIYLSAPEKQAVTTVAGKWVCVDNVHPQRADTRATYNRLYWQQATAVLVITQALVQDSLYPVQLQLTADDLSTVRTTLLALYRNCTLPNAEAESASLWMLVRACTNIDLPTNSQSR